MSSVTVTVLVENTAKGKGIIGEHGLAYWIETPTAKVIFDTGQGRALFDNAEVCGIDLREADAVLLSHGHYDHVGGLERFLQECPQVPVYFHPAATAYKTQKRPDGSVDPVSLPFLSGSGFQTANLKPFTAKTELPGGLFATGAIPRQTLYEDTGGAFFLDDEAQTVDPIEDDLALYFEIQDGTVVILGCAHAGIINTLNHIRDLTHDRKICAVIGGMHLLRATDERLKQTFHALRQMDIPRLGPCHCTGTRAIAAFWQHFPNQCEEVHAGKIFTF